MNNILDNNIKILGLEKDPHEDTRLAVCNLLKTKLGMVIKGQDIDAAHPLPKMAGQEEKAPNIIVRFTRRNFKFEVLQRRKQLKDSAIVIVEDLTSMNVKLMNRIRSHRSHSFSSKISIFLKMMNKSLINLYMLQW